MEKTQITQLEPEYNRAKTWQLACFSLNNIATNMAMMRIGFYAMFTQNVLGLSAVVVGFLATAMRIFDGITDPIVGFMIDKTNGKFGKFRPFMMIGNVIQMAGLLAIFNCPTGFSVAAKYIYTSIWYVVYVLGYTCQTACTKGAQAALTNDPKQRPVFSMFNAIFNVVFMQGMTYVLFTVLAPRFEKKNIDPAFWSVASLLFCVVMLVLTILAIIGIKEKDQEKYFGTGKIQKVHFRDYLPILKENRPLQMLIIAAATDKLALTTANAARTYLFANLFLNVALQGKYSSAIMIPQVVLLVVLISFARKNGQKKMFIVGTWASLLLLIAMYIIGPSPEQPIVFLVLMFLQMAAAQVSSNLVNTMIADCTDYETYRTGKFVPGMVGTLFSFVDKLVSSFSTTIWGVLLGLVGLGSTVLTPETDLGAAFNAIVMFSICGLPILGHVASIVSMRFYKLDSKMMETVQAGIRERKVKK